MRDLFGVTVETDRLPRDHEVYETFRTNEPEPVTDDDVDRYSLVAESIAGAVDVEALLGCGETEDEAACARRFVEAWAERVHRRPVAADERDEYVALFEWARSDGDSLHEAARVVVAAFLQSPSFLYRVERVAESATEPLDGYEIASRLSFFLWQTAPDADLLAAAAAGTLDDAEGIAVEARRLLGDARADDTIRSFHSAWLGTSDVEHVARVADVFDEELGRAMRRETEELALAVVREDGHLQALLSSDFTILDARMAEFYGASEGRTTLPDRHGLLTHASLMTAHAADGYTDPIYRGKMVRQRFFCQSIAPPPDVADEVAEREAALGDDLSERDRLTALTGNDPCVSCHVLTNGIGFAFSSYDAIGRFRDTDTTGATIDVHTRVEGGGSFATDVDGEYDGAAELSDALASSDDVARCVTAQWMRFALGRRTDADGASVAAAYDAFDASGRDVRELIVAITTTEAFRYRTAPGL